MISVKHLTKCYGEFTAVDDLSFEIDEGHVYGFLGPNGAGKSTTMNIITGCLSATSGQVTIDGHDIFEEPKEAKRAIGYLPEIPPLYTNETPEEYLKFVAEAKGLKGKEMEDVYEASRCVLDSAQEGQLGLTIRVLEALGAKKKLITTNEDVVNYDFYREENIYVYNGIFDYTSKFFKEPYREVEPLIYKQYSLRSWLTEILK